jgi:hypothetical protein
MDAGTIEGLLLLLGVLVGLACGTYLTWNREK